MAEIGRIKSVRADGASIVATVQTGRVLLTANIYGPGGSKWWPLVGDIVKFHRTGSDIVVDAVMDDAVEISGGECMIFARDADGQVVGSIHMENSGRVSVSPSDDGARVGNGTSPVTLASSNDAIWTALLNAMNTFSPPGTPDGGAALSAAIAAAITAGAGGATVDTGSSNLSAD